MSESFHRPKTVADNLGISPATLRLWSNEFHEVLSPAAQKATTETGTSAQRRYTDHDLAYFQRAKQLLGDGKTYEETLVILQTEDEPTLTEPTTETPPLTTSSVVLTLDDHPIIRAFEEVLRAKDQTISSLQETASSKDATISALQTTVSATERHVEDLRSENLRLREQLQAVPSPAPVSEPAPPSTTPPEVTTSPPEPLSWVRRLIRWGTTHGR